MRAAITVSLAINILVLVPVGFGLLTDAPWAAAGYGDETAARGILLAVYTAILAASVALLIRPVPVAVCTLLALQVVYKGLSPFTVGTLANPVILSNLAIAAVHLITLTVILSTLRRQARQGTNTMAPPPLPDSS